MSKTDSKIKWAEVDKRIRNRKKDFSSEEMRNIEATLQKLPDLADHVDIVTIQQPAVTPAEEPEVVEAESAEAPN